MSPLIPHWIAATALLCFMSSCLLAPLVVDGVCKCFNTDKGE